MKYVDPFITMYDEESQKFHGKPTINKFSPSKYYYDSRRVYQSIAKHIEYLYEGAERKKTMISELQDRFQDRQEKYTFKPQLGKNQRKRLPKSNLFYCFGQPSKTEKYDQMQMFWQAMRMLEGKKGYAIDLEKARELLGHLSDLNHSLSKFFFGFMMKHGLGGPIQMKEGLELIASLVNLDRPFKGFESFACGQFADAYLCDKRKENDKAYELLKKSSKHNSFAQAYFGILDKERYHWDNSYFESSAVQRNCMGQFLLGKYFLNYSKIPLALNFFKLSAARNYPPAQFALGQFYMERKKNKKLAVEWFSKAAENCHPASLLMLQSCYGKGIGIQRDLQKAHELFEKIAKLGIEWDEHPDYDYGYEVDFEFVSSDTESNDTSVFTRIPDEEEDQRFTALEEIVDDEIEIVLFSTESKVKNESHDQSISSPTTENSSISQDSESKEHPPKKEIEESMEEATELNENLTSEFEEIAEEDV